MLAMKNIELHIKHKFLHEHFGNKNRTALALGIKPQSIQKWSEFTPKERIYWLYHNRYSDYEQIVAIMHSSEKQVSA